MEAASAKLDLLRRQASQVLQLLHVGVPAKVLGLEGVVSLSNAPAVHQGACRHVSLLALWSL